MGLLDFLPKMRLGFQGAKPKFNAEDKMSTLHNQSSTLGTPPITRNHSILNEKSILNKNKFRSTPGQKYNDNKLK
jgi:hypothetical protein